MTDLDLQRAERLAALRHRRPGTPRVESATATAVDPSDPFGGSSGSAERDRRRRSPATTAKIVTVGASTTAVLGMMAGYGIADRVAASDPVVVPAGDVALPPAVAQPPTGPLAPPAAAPNVATTAPQVVVVMVDTATGALIATGDASLLDDLQRATATPIDGTMPADTATPETTASPTPTAPPAPSTLEPVTAPIAVDLAVPAPPPPRPAPAAAPTPAPAPQAQPQAQAQSSGS